MVKCRYVDSEGGSTSGLGNQLRTMTLPPLVDVVPGAVSASGM